MVWLFNIWYPKNFQRSANRNFLWTLYLSNAPLAPLIIFDYKTIRDRDFTEAFEKMFIFVEWKTYLLRSRKTVIYVTNLMLLIYHQEFVYLSMVKKLETNTVVCL